MLSQTLLLYLKETEFRYNIGYQNVDRLILKLYCENTRPGQDTWSMCNLEAN